MKIKDIIAAIEEFAPKCLQESYDNAGMQVGNPEGEAKAALLCLDVNEDIIREAKSRDCNLIISHHPLIFKGLKEIIGRTPVERIVTEAIKNDISIYAAHTNLDSAPFGVSHEIARQLGVDHIKVLEPKVDEPTAGLGAIGDIKAMPTLEFLRRIKEVFKVKLLKYSDVTPHLTVRKVAVCGGSGAFLIPDAIAAGADLIVTGDVKYHDFTSFSHDIVIADIGHYESELCTKKIFNRIIREKFPNFVTYFSESERNPINFM